MHFEGGRLILFPRPFSSYILEYSTSLTILWSRELEFLCIALFKKDIIKRDIRMRLLPTERHVFTCLISGIIHLSEVFLGSIFYYLNLQQCNSFGWFFPTLSPFYLRNVSNFLNKEYLVHLHLFSVLCIRRTIKGCYIHRSLDFLLFCFPRTEKHRTNMQVTIYYTSIDKTAKRNRVI